MEYSFVLGMYVGTKSEIAALLVKEAEQAVAAYPQYRGHFEGYKLGRATKTIKTKAGTAVEKGDLVLFKVEATEPEVLALAAKMGRKHDSMQVVFWSSNNKCDTVTKVGAIVEA